MPHDPHSRRRFLALSPLAVAALVLDAPRAFAQSLRTAGARHPDPRPGIDASRVLSHEQLKDYPRAVAVFDMVREMPQIVDGVRCNCGCGDNPDYYSLLSCFEGEAMGRTCPVCQGQARLAHALHKEKKSLAEIRSAIDARFAS